MLVANFTDYGLCTVDGVSAAVKPGAGHIVCPARDARYLRLKWYWFFSPARMRAMVALPPCCWSIFGFNQAAAPGRVMAWSDSLLSRA